MKTRYSLVIAVVAVLAGCGGSSGSGSELCSKAASTLTSVVAKVQECGGGTSTFDTAGCTTAAASCSSSDLATLDSYLDCLNDLPTCTAQTEGEFTSRATSCVAIRNGVSAACRNAFGS